MKNTLLYQIMLLFLLINSVISQEINTLNDFKVYLDSTYAELDKYKTDIQWDTIAVFKLYDQQLIVFNRLKAKNTNFHDIVLDRLIETYVYLARTYLKMGYQEKSFDFLELAINEQEQAIATDYSGYEDLYFDLIRHFKKFKFNSPDQFNDLFAKAKSLHKSFILKSKEFYQKERDALSPISICKYDNYIGSFDLNTYEWDDYNDPKVKKLREKYDLENIIDRGKTEFDKMLLLLKWVNSRWSHYGSNICKEKNALSILESAKHGERFRCVEYAIVLANCLNAIGFPARTVALRRDGQAYDSCKGHVCTEVWCNQYQKWIILDPQNNAYWRYNNIPLNSSECRDFLVNDQVDEVEFICNNEVRSDIYIWARYFYHIIFTLNNSFFKSKNSFFNERYELIENKVVPELFFQEHPENIIYTNNKNLFYPKLNNTKIIVNNKNDRSPSDTLCISLKHTMPYFKKHLYRINDSEWKEYSVPIEIVLRTGINKIEATAVNHFGIKGKISKIVLKNNL